ncbi:50S ribosomal protein L21 [Patescibacteria group bacterium]|nr:50S ribosomal protein L21 [Patescibacteria group bacterium]
MFAVIKTGGKQYKVKKGDKLKVEKLDAEKDKSIDFDEVLLVADEKGEDVKIGAPLVKGAKVSAKVLEQGRAKKIDVIKYKRKIRYKKKYGHRQLFTEVLIQAITA